MEMEKWWFWTYSKSFKKWNVLFDFFIALDMRQWGLGAWTGANSTEIHIGPFCIGLEYAYMSLVG